MYNPGVRRADLVWARTRGPVSPSDLTFNELGHLGFDFDLVGDGFVADLPHKGPQRVAEGNALAEGANLREAHPVVLMDLLLAYPCQVFMIILTLCSSIPVISEMRTCKRFSVNGLGVGATSVRAMVGAGDVRAMVGAGAFFFNSARTITIPPPGKARE